MLDILRKNAQSWGVKVLLGLIAIVFAFFFGSSSLQQATGDPTVAATVNGTPIPSTMLNGMVKLQMENNPMWKQLPQEFVKNQLRSSVIQNLIQGRILIDESHKLGFRPLEAEVGNTIKENPTLAKDNKFDLAFYKERFRPFFKQAYGVDYEEWIRQGISQNRIQEFFERSIYLSDQVLKKEYDLSGTSLTLKRVIVDPAALAALITPADDEVNKQLAAKKEILEKAAQPVDEAKLKETIIAQIKNDTSISQAKTKSESLWNKFKTAGLSTKELEAEGLTDKEVSANLNELESLFDGPVSPEAQSQIASLSLQSPFPSAPIEVQGKFYLFKLTEKKTPDPKDFETQKEGLQGQMTQAIAGGALANWTEKQVQTASIVISADPAK